MRSMESAATAPHGQLAVMGSDNLHVRCRSKNYYYYYYLMCSYIIFREKSKFYEKSDLFPYKSNF
ncbi:hypothetical protein BpHYR1_013057 [Brachionus plicatilis]|uniref:Uncharacterized protein n=1 Tax=Brachionus plicatilis TaxID=10195 RepID=A0A3M7RTT9_BRAPC|nr:hypothetical protein BpHYR1_013057 [Brachionus plicatilis]